MRRAAAPHCGQHYSRRNADHFKPGSFPEQLLRDRYVEDYFLAKGVSVFRIPFTLRTKKEQIVWASNYIKTTALSDSVARVHFIDSENTYYQIDGLDVAASTNGVYLRSLKPER